MHCKLTPASTRHHRAFLECLQLIHISTSTCSYVKGIYLQQIDAKAPNYLTEEYGGTTPCPKEDDLKQETCRIKIQIAPFHPDEPGLRVYYAYKNTVSGATDLIASPASSINF